MTWLDLTRLTRLVLTWQLLDVRIGLSPSAQTASRPVAGGAAGSRQQAAGGATGGRSLRISRAALNPTIVDSGTSFFFTSTPLYRALHVQLKASMPQLRRVGPHVCAHLTDAQRDSMPRFELVLDGNASSRPLVVRPAHYMVEYPLSLGAHLPGRRPSATRLFCAEIFDNADGGTVIGASLLRDREAIFDLASATVAFVDTDCPALTLATSRLRGAFAFAPCLQQQSRASRRHRLGQDMLWGAAQLPQ